MGIGTSRFGMVRRGKLRQVGQVVVCFGALRYGVVG